MIANSFIQKLAPPSLKPSQDAISLQISSQTTESQPKRKLCYEIIFLHNVYHVILKPITTLKNKENGLLGLLLDLLVEHFDLKGELVTKAILVDIFTKQPIQNDSQLTPSPSKFYFLALAHSLIPDQPARIQEAMKGVTLYSRKGRGYTIKNSWIYEQGEINELLVERRPGFQMKVHCPFIECLHQFPRSCDLVSHFRVQVSKACFLLADYQQIDIRPFSCQNCGKSFRRLAILNRHTSRCQVRNNRSHEAPPLLNFTSVPSQNLIHLQECDQCHNVFHNAHSLAQHRSTYHDNERNIERLISTQEAYLQIQEWRLQKVIQGISQIRKSKSVVKVDHEIIKALVSSREDHQLIVQHECAKLEAVQELINTNTYLQTP